MQFITITLLAALTGAMAAPSNMERDISVPSNLDNTDAAEFHLKCKGSVFVACAKAAGSTAKDCVEAIAAEGDNIIKDVECGKDIYEDFKKHKFKECKSCF